MKLSVSFSIRWIAGFIPIVFIYTERFPFFKKWMGGMCAGIFCVIRPKYKDDEGLHLHELEHCKQFLGTLGLHALLYKYSRVWRLWTEVKAYKVQLAESPQDLDLFAKHIAGKYNLECTVHQAKTLLLWDEL